VSGADDRAATDLEAYEIGSPVRCEDGPCGVLSRVVIDPIGRAVTHLIVDPDHRHAQSRLVPVAMADAAADAGEVRLRCTLATFWALQRATETEYLPVDDRPTSADNPGGGMALSGVGMGFGGAAMMSWPYWSLAPAEVVHERVPPGEVEIRRGEPIHAVDGTIGKVRGLVVDPADRHVTHVLLHEGHLWRAADVAIPITAVTGIDRGGVHVSLSRREIADLPEIEVTPPPGG